MSRTLITRVVVFTLIACGVACNDTEPSVDGSGINGTTELNLVISDPANAQEELTTLIDFVSYRIRCLDSGLAPYSDGVDLAGSFQANLSVDPPVWQLVTDLPPSECTISLWVWYEDEVICQGNETVNIVEDGDPTTVNKVNIVLECNLSVRGPSGDVDIDGGFDFINGNYCPKLFWLSAIPPTVAPAVPPVTTIETSAFDPDDTCGLNCDPQTCDFTQNPPVCTAGPDPGFSTTLIAPAGKGSFGTAVGTGNPVEFDTTYTCDPLFPGPTEICALASDGDNDCDQMRCITIECPDLCEGVVCADDGDECTREYCNPLNGQCVTNVAPDGIACADCTATCAGGTCSGPDWVGAVSGTTMNFQGTIQAINMTLTNPYSGQVLTLGGNFNVNNTSYEGVSSNDTLLGTIFGDFLLVESPVGTQRICGVENVLTQNNFDSIILANEFITLGDMYLEGGNFSDFIWANAGNDTLLGGNDFDFLDGGPGDDIIDGGNGEDTITLWPGCGFDSISGGFGTLDTIRLFGIQSQVLVTPAADPSYELDIFFLGDPMAQVRTTELLVLDDASIDLTSCNGPASDVCNLCGNDALNGGEECDDGNNTNGDGCAADCTAEY